MEPSQVFHTFEWFFITRPLCSFGQKLCVDMTILWCGHYHNLGWHPYLIIYNLCACMCCLSSVSRPVCVWVCVLMQLGPIALCSIQPLCLTSWILLFSLVFPLLHTKTALCVCSKNVSRVNLTFLQLAHRPSLVVLTGEGQREYVCIRMCMRVKTQVRG